MPRSGLSMVQKPVEVGVSAQGKNPAETSPSASGADQPLAKTGSSPREVSGEAPESGIAGGTPEAHSAASRLHPHVGALAVSLLGAIGEGVCLAARSGSVLWANEVYLRLSGAMLERLAATCRQFDRDHPPIPRGVTAPQGEDARAEVALAEDDRFFEAVLSPAPSGTCALLEQGGVPHDAVVIVVRDVTAARRLQQKINAIDQAGSELVRFEADLVRRLNAHERLKLIEAKITRYARDLLHFDHIAIRLLDEKSGRLELVMGCGLPADYDAFEIRPALEGHGISGFVAASGRSYVCADTSTDPLYLPGVEGARASLTVPLRLHDKVIGVMNVESGVAGAFGDEERQLGEIFARYIALSLHMLDLLVVERSTTNQTITGRVEQELSEPLEDILVEVEFLKDHGPHDGETLLHLDRIRADIDAVRRRIKECAAGPSTLLGAERALADKTIDPLLAGKRVLVADDTTKIRQIIEKVLTNLGCVVTACSTGGEAIAVLDHRGADAFDLVLSDIRMPDRNGYEVFAASKKQTPRAPVILMTGFGYDPHHSIVRASQEGLQNVLFKPFQVESLLQEVRKALAPKA